MGWPARPVSDWLDGTEDATDEAVEVGEVVGPDTPGGTAAPIDPGELDLTAAGLGIAEGADPAVPPPRLNPKAREPPPGPENGSAPAAEGRARPDVAFEPPRPRMAPPAELEVFDSEWVISGPRSPSGAAAIASGAAVADEGANDPPVTAPAAPPPPIEEPPTAGMAKDGAVGPLALGIGGLTGWTGRPGSFRSDARLNGNQPKPGGATIALADFNRSRGVSATTGL